MKIQYSILILIIALLFVGQASAIIDTNISFTNPDSINDVKITGTNGGNLTINISDSSLYLYDNYQGGLPETAQIYFSKNFYNVTVDMDVYPETTTDYFNIILGANQIYLLFNASSIVSYMHFNGSYVNIAPYTINRWQHLQINYNVTNDISSVTWNGTTASITHYTNTTPYLAKIVVNTHAYYKPKFRIANLTIKNNELPELPVTTRKFPYPYKAAWTISSDIDNYNQTELFAIMDFFNTNETIYENDVLVGTGLGLDISQNFWMGAAQPSQLGYYAEFNTTPNDIAPYLLEYMQSGHMDAIHTWSNSQTNSTTNGWLKSVISFLRSNNINITTYIDHSSKLDNIGSSAISGGAEYFGDNSTNLTYYHTNETIDNYSVRYIWEYESYNYSYASSAISISTLNDSNVVFAFSRNKIDSASSTPSLTNFSGQTNENDLNSTIRRNGYNVLITHLGYTQGTNPTPIPIFDTAIINNLNIYKNHFYGTGGYSQDLYVTTLSKLLKYNEVSLYLNYTVSGNDFNITNINSPVDSWIPTIADLQGITFYTNSPTTARVFLNGVNITTSVTQNTADETGQTSIMFPITRPTYPFSPNRIYNGGIINNVSTDHISYSVRPLSTNLTNLTIIPSSDSLNVTISTWNTTGDYRKVWNESSSNGTNEVRYHIGDNLPQVNYTVKIYWDNGTKFQDFYIISNNTGYLNYNNTGFEYPRYTEITYITTPSNPYPVLIITVTVVIGGVYYYLRRIRKA